MTLLPPTSAVAAGGRRGPNPRDIPPDPLAPGVPPADPDRFLRGLGEAGAYRRSLLAPGPGGETGAARLGKAVARFRARAAPGLAGRPGPGAFAVPPEEFTARVHGVGRRVDRARRSGRSPAVGTGSGSR